MAKNLVQKAEEQILKGKTHQEIFNEIVSQTDFNIHKVADAIRKIPTIEKRKKYALLNNILVTLLIIHFSFSLLSLILSYQGFFEIIPLIIILILVYCVIKYKPNAHLFTGALLIISTVRGIYPLISTFSVQTLIYVIFIVSTSILAFYLGSKLANDYVLNKDLLKENPNQRVDIITFVE